MSYRRQKVDCGRQTMANTGNTGTDPSAICFIFGVEALRRPFPEQIKSSLWFYFYIYPFNENLQMRIEFHIR